MVYKLLARGSALNLIALVQVFQQFSSGGLGHTVLEVRTDVCGTVWAVLLAQIVEDHCGGLLRSEFCLFLVFFGWRHCDGAERKPGWVRLVAGIDFCSVRKM
jgi:hypothetical protein